MLIGVPNAFPPVASRGSRPARRGHCPAALAAYRALVWLPPRPPGIGALHSPAGRPPCPAAIHARACRPPTGSFPLRVLAWGREQPPGSAGAAGAIGMRRGPVPAGAMPLPSGGGIGHRPIRRRLALPTPVVGDLIVAVQLRLVGARHRPGRLVLGTGLNLCAREDHVHLRLVPVHSPDPGRGH